MAKKLPESDDDFSRMQQDAINRVREMQKRARATLESAGMHIEPASTDLPESTPSTPMPPAPHMNPAAEDGHEKKTETKNLNTPTNQNNTDGNADNHKSPLSFLNLSLDSEQIMLIACAYLLFKDGADTWLILALVYIIMT